MGDGAPGAERRGRRVLRPAVSYARSFSPSSAPHGARRAYRLELRSDLLLPWTLVFLNPAVLGVLVRNAYDGAVEPGLLNLTVAALAAMTPAANIVSFVWVRISHGRRKARLATLVLTALCVLVGLLALAPISPTGLVVFVALAFGASLCWAGFLTLRSGVWRQNYAREIRASLTGRLSVARIALIASLAMAVGAVLNEFAGAFRWMAPLGCVVGLVGALAWRRMPVMGERAVIAAELAGADSGEPRPSFNPLRMFHILLGDRQFAKYMGLMFILGGGNLMVAPVLVIVLKEQFDLRYLGGMLFGATIPMLVMPIATPLWGRLLNKWHVVRFRAVHAWVFASASTGMCAASLVDSPTLLVLSVVAWGAALGGGVLAWTLGHLDFAPPHLASQYMGVHVTLTGVRGLAAPFAGLSVYSLAAWVQLGPLADASFAGRRAIEWMDGLPVQPGAVSFACSGLLAATAAVGFGLLARGYRSHPGE